ncbi:hypothetical protein [Butyrivibrio sp. INlla16]|uniref:hypothetical protein n=1 Tax=Butyrivibrio sp. INlla16 TaxID=1520807 RepID=UPI000891F263|nr:hypothetical protein [Butyrivibrio sp. INlla16]SDB62124.1 hypothetical protein SAMN02910263_03349 [Butyrivibrio sp. INlla16]
MRIDQSEINSTASRYYDKQYGQTGKGSNMGFVGLVDKTTETETTTYEAKGTVKTTDGRSIDVDMNASMERCKVSEVFVPMASPLDALFDPLIINTGADTAGLSDKKFKFDLDADGKEDEISTLGEGSGFLVLDKNEDGKINDGNELFGVKSGDGFKDLAEYDTDSNGWIDENDEVFDQLKVWYKTENGDELKSLKDAGVGAIFLGAEETEFRMDGADQVLDGKIRKTGMFLKENGGAGTIQHVDMAIKGREAELLSDEEKLDQLMEQIRNQSTQNRQRNNNNTNAQRRAQRAARQKKQLEEYYKKKDYQKQLTEKAIKRREMMQ